MADDGTPPTPVDANREALTLLAALLDIDIVDMDSGSTLCCDGESDFKWFSHIPWIVRHDATCPWMRGHALLNRSTYHDEQGYAYAHAWRIEGDEDSDEVLL